MTRSSTAEKLTELPIAPPTPRMWRDTLFRRARSFVANAFFESLSATGRLHPAASPKRHGVELESDIAYGPRSVSPPRYLSPDHRPKPWPVVFYVHGGAFHLLSKDTHWLMGLVFARFGYMVVNISYRLAPKHPFPAAIEDTCRAYTWMASRVTGARRRSESRRGRGRVGRRQLDHVARARVDLGALRAVGSRGVRLRRAAARGAAVLRDAAGQRDGSVLEAPQDAALDRRNDRATPVRPTCMATRACAAMRPRSRIRCSRSKAPPRATSPSIDPYHRSSHPSVRAIPCSTIRAASKKRSPTLNAPCEARYYPGGIHAFHAMVWDPAARRCWRDALAFLDRHMR